MSFAECLARESMGDSQKEKVWRSLLRGQNIQNAEKSRGKCVNFCDYQSAKSCKDRASGNGGGNASDASTQVYSLTSPLEMS